MADYFLTSTDLQARLSSAGYNLRVDDNFSAVTQVQQDATNRLRFYCLPNYTEADLLSNSQAGGWTNDRATDFGAYLLCRRRGNPVPQSIVDAYKEAVEMCEGIHQDIYEIPGISERFPDAPVMSNLNVNPHYNYKKLRVETSISSLPAPTGYAQVWDWGSAFSVEF